MLHELKEHKIKLEIQNEQLRSVQKDLEASLACYFDLYEHAPVIYFVVNEKFLIIEANLAADTLMGKIRGELINQSIKRFILSDDQDIYSFHHKKLFETRKSQAVDLRMLKGDGTFFWARMEARAGLKEDGTPIGRIIFIDTTDSKQIEEKYRLLLNNSVDMISKHAPDGTVLYVNPACDALSGYNASELIGKAAEFLVFSEDAAVVWNTIRQQQELGNQYRVEHRLPRKDGSVIWVETNGRLIRDKDGEINEIECIVRDISARKRAEETNKMLMELSSKCINIPIEKSHSAIVGALGKVGQFIDADAAYVVDYNSENNSFSKTHAWHNNEIQRRIYNLDYTPVYAEPEWIASYTLGEPVVLQDIAELPATGIRVALESQNIKSLVSVPLFHDDYLKGFMDFYSMTKKHVYSSIEIQTINFLARIIINLQIRVSVEQNLINLNKTLDEKVKNRTDKLRRLNEYLIDTEEKERRSIASDLHDSVTQTLGVSVAQIKNLEESHPNIDLDKLADVKGYLLYALKEVRAMIYQLNPPILDDFTIDIALGVLIEEFNNKHDIKIHYVNKFDASLKVSHSVKVLLYRSVHELILNIVKHSGSKKAEVEFWVAGVDIKLRIQDYGIGIAANMIQNMPFQGFGLYSISERIENSGGIIQFFSDSGKGTTVLLSLPCLA